MYLVTSTLKCHHNFFCGLFFGNLKVTELKFNMVHTVCVKLVVTQGTLFLYATLLWHKIQTLLKREKTPWRGIEPRSPV